MLKELAEEIGDLTYDALAEFLNELSKKIEFDGGKDRARGRVKLATCLEKTSGYLKESTVEINKAWRICKPYM